MAYSESFLRQVAENTVSQYFEKYGRRMRPGAADAAVKAALLVSDQGRGAICHAIEWAMVPFRILKIRDQDRPSNRKLVDAPVGGNA